MTFPSHFPEGCPPEKATEYEGPFYRFAWEVPNDPMHDDNHKPYSDLKKPDGTHKYRYSLLKECQACSLSGYIRREDIELHLQKLRVERPKDANKPVFILNIIPGDGVLTQTPGLVPSHHSLWVREGITIRERMVVKNE